jgi:C-terminal processing protease CtpA/Prc
VLTSARTFSGGEEFAYDLQTLKRATIIGETTGGGANTVQDHWIDDRFDIRLPSGRGINPITKTNWEGVGVQPDIAAPAADALEKAQSIARKRVRTN